MTIRDSSALAAIPLEGWADPAAVFAQAVGAWDDAFYLDAGVDADSGWSYFGHGLPSSATAPLDVSLQREPSRNPWEAGPFRGGWVCSFDYDNAAMKAGAPATTAEHASALWVDTFLAWDHAAKCIWSVAPAENARDLAAAWQERIAKTPRRVGAPAKPNVVAHARHTATEYAEHIERCRQAIREGDAYQLCLTTRFTVEGSYNDVDVFLRLREQTSSHHGAFIRTGGTTLVSASPEQFLTVTQGRVLTKPIKGTRPRGTTAEHDAQLAQELLGSEKERAENVMIVDLMRNDLSRVCEQGSIRVDGLWLVESYPAVHQLVSTVSGRVRDGSTFGELLDATFPAGSMTGAPKLSAMTILHGLERGPRGAYAGCFGWIGTDGQADLAMTIRTIIIKPEEAYVGAGGGITWLSIAAEEVAEVAIKAKAPLAALGAHVPPEWEQAR